VGCWRGYKEVRGRGFGPEKLAAASGSCLRFPRRADWARHPVIVIGEGV